MRKIYRKILRNSRSGLAPVAIGSILLIFLAGSIGLAQDISINSSIDKDQVRVGESISLTISLSGPVRSIGKPDLPDLSDFDVYSSGTSSNISIVPGSVSYQTDYSYIMVPRKAGTFTIAPVKVEHNGKVYKTKPLVVTVLPQSQQAPPSQSQPQPQQPQRQPQRQTARQTSPGEDFFVEQTVDTSSPYVGQQVTLIFRFYQAENLFEQPTLQWPDFKGMWVEDLPPNKTYTTTLHGRTYRVTEIRRALFPTITGKLRIDETVLRIPPQAFFDSFFGRDPFNFFNRGNPRQSYSEKVLQTKGIVLTVKPLPTSGKPDNFSEAVGTYLFQASIDHDTVEVDQPVTLKGVVSGTGNIKKLPAIDIPELQNFRLYDSGSNENISKNNGKVSGSKTFEWVLIPTAPGDYELPSLKFTYFDPWSRKYRTTTQSPGKVHVKPSSMANTAPGDRSVNVIPAARTSLNYIVTDYPTDGKDSPLYTHTWVWILQLVPIVWLAALAIYVGNRKRLEGDIAYARRKTATKAARKALKDAREGFDSPEKFYSNIFNGIIGFISNKMNISAQGLTNRQIIELLGKTGRCETIIDDFSEFLNQCDAGRFSPVKPDQSRMHEIYGKAERLLSELDRGLR